QDYAISYTFLVTRYGKFEHNLPLYLGKIIQVIMQDLGGIFHKGLQGYLYIPR
uniref:Uncharacterized protein n=1 Tax=Amphimedon queenslandica TaxID=400682 RepID=A0A1X7UNM3_AMPQE